MTRPKRLASLFAILMVMVVAAKVVPLLLVPASIAMPPLAPSPHFVGHAVLPRMPIPPVDPSIRIFPRPRNEAEAPVRYRVETIRDIPPAGGYADLALHLGTPKGTKLR
jgi:hypothetical protein